MKQYYFFTFFLALFLWVSAPAVAQESAYGKSQTEHSIDGLSIYPNPVTNGKVYINTTFNLEKEIEIYNVIGKPIYKTRLRGKEMDVSTLSPGIYILKITENGNRATRKLVVK
ncbi:MAG: T9SS type A sorting domain-containing protein [Bacteroidota bacterium]